MAKEIPKDYLNLIYAKFLRSLKYGNDFFKLIDNDIYFKVYHDYIEHLLNRENAIIRLAVLSDDETNVLGWSLMEAGILHYVFVMREQRRQGIAKELCKSNFHTITHLTNTGASIFSKMKNVKFNPFI